MFIIVHFFLCYFLGLLAYIWFYTFTIGRLPCTNQSVLYQGINPYRTHSSVTIRMVFAPGDQQFSRFSLFGVKVKASKCIICLFNLDINNHVEREITYFYVSNYIMKICLMLSPISARYLIQLTMVPCSIY